MNNCVNGCGNEVVGRSKYCSDKCKVAYNRNKSVTDVTVTESVTTIEAEALREVKAHAKPVNFGQPDCECMMCKTNRINGNKHAINHRDWKPAHELGDKELNRITLPGDVDYKGVCNSPHYDDRRTSKAIASPSVA